ncbi:hypothetical protein PVAP13_4KG231210 [Panicum virgatum]|uniref:Uncharacterized protein n=1 Tax=Panicum virgatum TaxID=38727 RepID=A0A8T0TT48_PANVG|nr:hypothetical protein PVAP13_4KG231210 [Panicum virgatum]
MPLLPHIHCPCLPPLLLSHCRRRVNAAWSSSAAPTPSPPWCPPPPPRPTSSRSSMPRSSSTPSFSSRRRSSSSGRGQELQERIQWAAEAKPSSAAHAEIARIQCEVVDFHGQMVLLLNYSSINYRPRQDPQEVRQAHGGVLRLPVITGVLQQPFFTTDLISEIVRDCEAMMEAVFPATATAAVFAASRDLEERQALAAAEQGQLHHRRLLAFSHIGGHFSLLELARARLAAAWGWSAAGVVLLQLAGGGSAARMTTS